MANINITVDGTLMDGHRVTFKAPCDCTNVEKLKVHYIENGTQKNKLFTMKDSHGKDLNGLGNLFAKGAYVHAILDTVNGFAYLQNADTNSYLEEKIALIGDGVTKIVFATEEPTTVADNTVVMVYEV